VVPREPATAARRYGRVHASPAQLDVDARPHRCISKTSNVSFDGFKAINDLSLDIAPGELRCIIGPNGAGKTTMMDIITGKTRPDTGTGVFRQHASTCCATTSPRSPQLGIGRKFQKPTVFEQLSVFEKPRARA
jgi:urea transport system ATP-binding protein